MLRSRFHLFSDQFKLMYVLVILAPRYLSYTNTPKKLDFTLTFGVQVESNFNFLNLYYKYVYAFAVRVPISDEAEACPLPLREKSATLSMFVNTTTIAVFFPAASRAARSTVETSVSGVS